MDIKKKWDKYEAAILLDYYLHYLNGRLSRKEAIQIVSEQLRKLAKTRNINIDDVYRNISGITFQMHSMESAYKGYTIVKPASRLFNETVKLLKNDKNQFDKLLRKAKQMIDTTEKDASNRYLDWLSGKVTPAQLSELYMSYETINEFCINTKVLKNSLLETTDIDIVKLAQKTVEQNKVFRFRHKREINKFSSAMRYYLAYIRENMVVAPNNVTPTENQVAKKVEQSITENRKDEGVKEFDEAIVATQNLIEDVPNDKSYTTMVISFSEIPDLSYTKPIYATYFGDEIQCVSSWKQLYVNAFKKLYEDYDDRIPINESFNANKGRMDFCTGEYYNLMISPKEIVTNKYLETNLSATDIVRKIKCLLDICLVDEENLIIRYIKKGSIRSSETIKTQKSFNSSVNAESFYNWLSNEQNMALPTCRSYVSAVNTAERYAKDNGFANCILYTNNYQEAKLTVDELFDDKVFVEYNDRQHNRFRAGVNKLLLYIGGEENSVSGYKHSVNLELFSAILVEKFSKGYRVGSHLELKKFKRYWDELYGNPIEMPDDSITKHITLCGIIHEGKLYMPQEMLDEEIKTKLFSYINDSFRSGKNIIYYEALFKEFSEDFLDHCMYNADMLKGYLTYMNNGSYYTNKNYISKEANISVSTYDEVKNCLVQQATPMEYDEIFSDLSHIPEQKIKSILAQYNEFISNGRNEYFHISIAAFSDEELEDIAMIIQSSIDEKRFIGGNELIDSIKKKYPYIIEKNTLLSDKGLRDAIGYKFRDRFSFKGNIISSQGQALSMMEVFADFCKHNDSFTLDELKVLKQELDTVIYFDAVYENSLRISKNEFVAKSHAAFKPEETDAAINRFCDGDYIAIGKIQQFGLFPDAGFGWNSYLLEHYVAMYSPNYKLVHSNYNEGVCVGAIVKKLSNINTLDELVVDLLAKSGLPLQKDVALQYLCDEGYLARRSYSGIEQLLIKAQELRNQKGF